MPVLQKGKESKGHTGLAKGKGSQGHPTNLPFGSEYLCLVSIGQTIIK